MQENNDSQEAKSTTNIIEEKQNVEENELKNGNMLESFKLKNMKPYQSKRLIYTVISFLIVAILFLTYSCTVLYKDKKAENEYWDNYLTIDSQLQNRLNEVSSQAVKVQIGTYVENLKEIDLKSNIFSLDYLVWFNWDGPKELNMAENFRIYKGDILKKDMVKELHEGEHHYQLVRLSVDVSKVYWTPRFPLDSHQLRIYVESTHPADKVVFLEDKSNTNLNPNMSIAGYGLSKYDNAVVANEYVGNNGDPQYVKPVITSEYVTQIEINRSGFGVYLKCFIALFGTSLWMFLVLYINSMHRVDPLDMIPGALFGAVSNIMIGASLLPDALNVGLLEYVNFWGIFTILAVACVVINVNRIRSRYDERRFAKYYGETMLKLIVCVTVLGHILLPLCAYKL